MAKDLVGVQHGRFEEVIPGILSAETELRACQSKKSDFSKSYSNQSCRPASQKITIAWILIWFESIEEKTSKSLSLR